MIEWVARVVDAVEAEARRDPEYQELLTRQTELAPVYDAMLAGLKEAERELILEYTDVALNRQYRFAQLAWDYGRRNGYK